ncbi:universal stress protein [Arthrobacter sp. STN4]|uniref:universal stress protein n=1 Tax=Arthrobacter sp. STN4 TaxID=2923276 RepID=UPI00211A9FBE|nr:universal stress protein [Arthrobacter sp. STN4]MCQ9164462.1 universal stress protein [Arthrobacter sp. STN4]
MPVIVGYVPTPVGEAALERGIHEASLRGERLVIVNASAGDAAEGDPAIATAAAVARVAGQLENAGIGHEIRQPQRAGSPADELLRIAAEDEASLIVIGLRRRSPVGKILFGSTAQEVLLNADCPVVAVKPDRHPRRGGRQPTMLPNARPSR